MIKLFAQSYSLRVRAWKGWCGSGRVGWHSLGPGCWARKT